MSVCKNHTYPSILLFKGSEIDTDCLEHMIEADLVQLIPKIHERIKFRARLDEWKKIKYPEEREVVSKRISLATGYSNAIKNVDLLHILKSTEVGNSVLDHFKRERSLNEFFRRKLIKTVVEYFVLREIALGTKECNTLADKIIQVFPSEVKVKIFHYDLITHFLLTKCFENILIGI